MQNQHSETNVSFRHFIPLIILSIITTIISTLCVQVTLLHYGPYVRAIQCYFNEIILEHTSLDIYQGSDVIYWRTAQYNSLEDIYNFYSRFSSAISTINSESLINLNQTLIQTVQIQLSAEYDYKQAGVFAVSFNQSYANIQQLIDRTMFNRTFYQYLDMVKIRTVIPIINDQYDFIDLVIHAEFFSNLQMQVTLQADPKVYTQYDDYYPQGHIKSQSDEPMPGVHKLTRYNRLTLNNQWIRWVVIGFNIIISIYIYVELAIDQKKINLRPIKISLKQNIYELGLPRIICLVISFLAILFHFAGDGYVCLFCWFRLTAFLSFTNNPFMLGFLMKRAIPTYAKLMFNLLIILTAFVFLSMTLYGFSKKFETLKLSYYQYLFNFFQYGIYENFQAVKSYGIIANLFYFLHMIIAVSIGNNILQSILASELLKNSYLNSLKDFIQGINCKCPKCFASAEVKKKVKINVKSKSRFISQFLEEHFSNKVSNYQYEINITSPKLSPYFHPQKTKLKKKKVRNQPLTQSIISQSGQSKPAKLLLFEIGEQEKQLSVIEKFNQKIRANFITLFQLVDNLKVKRQQQSTQKDFAKKQTLLQALKKIQKIQQNLSDI